MKARDVLASLVVLASLALAPPVRADDEEARRLLEQAYGHWRDATPDECLRLGEAALAAGPEKRSLRAQILLFLGSLHHLKTGRIDAAIARYDEVITVLRDRPDAPLKPVLADAMVRKGNLLYAERDDPQGALDLYIAAQQVVPLASTADTACQLLYRLGRAPGGDPAKQAERLDTALTLSREALELCPAQYREEPLRGRMLARFHLQRTIVLEGLGRHDEASAEWAEVDPAQLDDNTLYQRSILDALRGDPVAAGAAMRRFMATRPTVETRNQLRKFIRTEPDLAPLGAREDWRDLVTDEPAPPPAPATPPAPTPPADGPR